ncbi:MAG: CxxxxCH/CxxCH domain-containing protein [Polyangiaceae bacterium]
MQGRFAFATLGATVCAALLMPSCSADRETPTAAPTFATDVAPILDAHCTECHAGNAPAAGWSATSYLSTIACVSPSAAVATLPNDANAPILSALSTPPHAGLLASREGQTLLAWVAAGTPAFLGTVHSPGIIDPRSPDFHGTQLRAKHWAPMLDPDDPQACGRCHDGTPVRPTGITSSAPGATSCTTCHSNAGGPLACDTCHGNGTRAYPPRDLCFFKGDSSIATAHAAHVEPSSVNAGGLPCSTCHPAPGANVISGLHGNGAVEVAFDPTRVTPEASYDPTTKACAVTCHDRGGTRPNPKWSETTAMTCNSCHASPPANHFPGTCNSCHAEANADGTALNGGPLHMNGRVDLGNGNGTCGACHGSGSDPWPTTAAHPHHENPSLTAPLACSSCHTVPSAVIAAGHLNGVVDVRFSGLATARGAQPVWNGVTCSAVACHGANLADVPKIPVWNDPTPAAAACGACHGIPPSQHTASTSCDRSICHGTEITRDGFGIPSISKVGLSLHINGVIDSVNP